MNAKNYVQDIVRNEDHLEGPVAKAIENQTAKLPSDMFLWLAAGSIGASATLHLLGRRETSNFVGQWAPTFLILGLYNKIVKAIGSDKQDAGFEEKQEADFQEQPKKVRSESGASTENRSAGKSPRGTFPQDSSKRSDSQTSSNSSSSNAPSYSNKKSGDPEGLQQSAAL